MSLFKIGLVLVIFVTLLVVIGSFALQQIPTDQIPDQLQPLIPYAQQVRSFLSLASDQIQQNSTKVLGESIQKKDLISEDAQDGKPLHERAFDYARYQYCLQVVKDYESSED